MKRILLLLVLIIPLSFYAQEGITKKEDESQFSSKKSEKKEKKKSERDRQKQRKKEKDSIYVIYYARKDSLSKYPPYNLKEDGYLIFKIQDINLLRYSVSLNEFQNDIISSTRLNNENSGSQININPDVFSFNSELEILQPLIIKTKVDESKKEALEDLENEVKKLENKIKYSEDRIDEIKKSIIAIEKIISRKKELQDQFNLVNGHDNQEEKLEFLKKQISEIDEKFYFQRKKELIDKRELVNKELEAYNDSLLDKTNAYRKSKKNLYKSESQIVDYNESLNSYFNALQNLNKLNNVHQRLLNILSSDKSWKNIESLKKEFIKNIIEESSTKKEIKDFNSNDLLIYCQDKLDVVIERFHNLSEAYSELDSVSRQKSEIVKHFAEVSTVYKQIPKNSYRLFFAQIIKTFEAINDSNFNLKYRTLVVSDNADVIKYSLKGIPHSNLPFSVETKEITLNYDVRIKGGVKIDVSTGIFWNIGLIDRTFRFEDVDPDPSTDSMTNTEDKVRVIRETNDNLFVPSFGVLFHLYRRSYSSTKLGFNIGASTNGDRVNYYFGGSLLVGKSQRINFNFGVAGAQVTEATDMFDTEEAITAPGDLTRVPTQRPFRLGLYAGVTFNLIGNSNKQALYQVRSQITKL